MRSHGFSLPVVSTVLFFVPDQARYFLSNFFIYHHPEQSHVGNSRMRKRFRAGGGRGCVFVLWWCVSMVCGCI